MSWNYNREEGQQYTIIPEGPHRVRIETAEKAVSKAGNDMLNLKLEVSGHNGYLFDHIVFLQDRPEITNRKLTNIFDSFKDIKEGDFNLKNWHGKVGAVQVKHEEYNGNQQAKVHYYINANNQNVLPQWKEPQRSNPNESKPSQAPTDADGFASAMEKELPF